MKKQKTIGAGWLAGLEILFYIMAVNVIIMLEIIFIRTPRGPAT